MPTPKKASQQALTGQLWPREPLLDSSTLLGLMRGTHPLYLRDDDPHRIPSSALEAAGTTLAAETITAQAVPELP